MYENRNTMLPEAKRLAAQGKQVVPIIGKHPPIKWKHLNETGEIPSEELLDSWWSVFPEATLGLITGKPSGYVVVDCDSTDAIALAKKLGFTDTPVRSRTKNGMHYYWKWPEGQDYIAGQVGANANGIKWPSFKGLDFRATGNIAVIPPTPNYEWDIDEGKSMEDAPVWIGFDHTKLAHNTNVVDIHFKPENIILPKETRYNSGGVWQQAHEKAAKFANGKLPTGGGNGRNDMLYRYLGERCAAGVNNRNDLMREAVEFQTEFFEEPFPTREVWDSVDRLIDQDKRAHPERYVEPLPDIKSASDDIDPDMFKPITTSDIERLKSELGNQEYFIEPFLPTSGTIMQVFGYSGHGKSMFIRHALYMASAMRSRIGCFDSPKAPKVLYFDFENSRSNVTKFLERSAKSFGDAEDRFAIWAPFDTEDMITLNTDEGKRLFLKWVIANKPDVVVIDTVRSAFPGMSENSAEDWGKVNELAMKLRNNGISCVLVHHSNKPSEHGMGREAGSTNQLTVLETQIRVTQVYRDKDQALQNAGIWDGDLEHSIYDRLESFGAIASDERIDLIVQLRYGKVREWTDMHEPVQYVAFVSNTVDKSVRLHSIKSPKQQARDLCRPYKGIGGQMQPPMSDQDIAAKLDKPLSTIQEWTQYHREYRSYTEPEEHAG